MSVESVLKSILTFMSLDFRLSLFRVSIVMPVSHVQSEAGVREFHIVQVSSSSRQWRLHKCINPAGDKGTGPYIFIVFSFCLFWNAILRVVPTVNKTMQNYIMLHYITLCM